MHEPATYVYLTRVFPTFFQIFVDQLQSVIQGKPTSIRYKSDVATWMLDSI